MAPVNFLAHTSVALATGGADAAADPSYLLGAALPDLASMAGVRLNRARPDGPVGAGLRCHIVADAVFHAHPAFRDGARAIGAALMQDGLRRGPARAVGHAGWELLLDGALVGSEVEAAFHRAFATSREVDVAAAIAGPDRPRWSGFLARWERASRASGTGAPVRLRYDDPGWVADRLHAMLANRRLLAFPSEDVPTVRRVLTAHAPPIADVAGRVLADVTEGVTEMLDCRP